MATKSKIYICEVKSKEKPCDTSNSTQSWNELKTILGKFYWNNLFNSFNVLFCIGGGGSEGAVYSNLHIECILTGFQRHA